LDELLSAADLSEEKFIRKVYQNTGMYPKEYLLDFRIKHAAKLLENSNESISDVAFHCGFTDPSLFNRQFKAKTGMMPSKYRDLYKREVKHEVVGE
jgi:AraC-like DNA-binding protein